MKNLDEVILFEGEEVLNKIEGDAYNDDPNPLMKLAGFFTKIIFFVLGISQKIYMVQTTNRILLVEKGMILWFIPRDTKSIALSKEAIDYVGYTQARRWLVFKSLYFNLALRSGQAYEIKFTGKLPELVNIANGMNKGLFQASTKLRQVA